jgi:hypothetical protein
MNLSSLLYASVVACAALAPTSGFAGKPVVTEAGTPPEVTASTTGMGTPNDCTKPPKKKGGGGGGHDNGSLSTYRMSSGSCGSAGGTPNPAQGQPEMAVKGSGVPENPDCGFAHQPPCK